MEPLFETTVKDLIENTEKRILELDELRKQKRTLTYKNALACDSYEKLRVIMDAHREHDLDSRMNQYTENLEYLTECDQQRKVTLTQTEWRHYFHGAQRPEWC